MNRFCYLLKFFADLLVPRIGVLVALTEVDLRALLLGPSLAWNSIDGMITRRRNRFGSNAAAEFEVNNFLDA